MCMVIVMQHFQFLSCSFAFYLSLSLQFVIASTLCMESDIMQNDTLCQCCLSCYEKGFWGEVRGRGLQYTEARSRAEGKSD